MEAKKRTSKPSTNKSERRRGRPSGKNRVPLSLEERRARNALYERERRNENAEAMAQLADAASCDQNITNAELLATVISRLQCRQKRPKKHSLEDLQRINDNLESQIALLEKRLMDDPNFNADDLDKSDTESSSSSSSESDTDSDSDNSDTKRPTKCRKTSERSSVHSETTRHRIKYESTSSMDSKDTVWSSNQSDCPKEQTDSPQGSNRSSVMYSPESIAPEPHDSEVKLEFQFVSEQDFLTSQVDQSETAYSDSCDGTENKILNCLKSEDLFCFGTDANELNLDWPLSDFNDILTTFNGSII